MSLSRNRPLPLLTRRFFSGMFDLGFLSDTGAATFTRMIIGTCATFLSFALILIQLYAVKYLNLTALPTSQPYRDAIVADHAFLISVPMWIVAFVTILVGHALFPDETDFRVVGPLPVTRRTIFEAKLLAVVLFAAVFIAAAHVALLPVVLVMSSSPWTDHALAARIAAHWFASLLASWFAAFAVMALHGVLLLTVPASRSPIVTAGIRSALLCTLILVLPFLVRLPSHAADVATAERWLAFVPPVWFLGIERWLLGDTRLAGFAWVAGPATIAVLGIAAVCYALLYRNFEHVVLRRASGHSRQWSSPWRRLNPPGTSRPVFEAVAAFTSTTLRRSTLHQGIVVVLSAVGVGLVVNSLLDAGAIEWAAALGRPGQSLVESVVWAPFALVFVVTFAVRTAVLVPIDVRANWIFRVAEQDVARVDQLRAGAWTVARLGVLVPLALFFPAQWLVLGNGAVVATGVALVCGLMFHAVLMEDWARIPFTCSYLPGKSFLPQIVITGIVSFALFTIFGTALAHACLAGSVAAWTACAGLVATVVVLHGHRNQMWRDIPIDYEDELPTEARSLRLHE